MPRTLGQAAGFVLGLWLALALGMPLAARGVEPRADAGALARLEADLYAAVNALRGRRNLTPLERRPELDAVARAHSRDMAERGYFSHDTPEGLSPVDRIERAGIKGHSLAGENVGLTTGSQPTRAILEGWKASPDHRRNLLARPFNATGVGVVRAANGTLYFTQLYVTFPRGADDQRGNRAEVRRSFQ